MLTKDQQKFFLDYFKNVFYNDDKITIEEFYKKIENPKVRKTRDRLLLESEKSAIKFAKKAVRRIKNESFAQLLEATLDPKNNSPELFGDDLLDEIENDLK